MVILAFTSTILLFRVRLIIDDTSITVIGLRSRFRIPFDQIESLGKMRVIGTVANSPLLIRSITLNLLTEKEQKISVYLYALQDILDVLQILEDEREQ